ncbi:MAG: GDP-mannose 4,6-dehydratase [Oscillospiraceae bacterium]|nr:GDP-mannose 4,6-dehydratase [Oscillospiraceae bacterium]
MKALITGSRGFAGRHLSAELISNNYTVYGIDLHKDENTTAVDILDRQAIRECIKSIKPDVIFHLAAQAEIPLSWKKPQLTFEVNVIGTVNLLEAVREENPACRIVLIGSADQYGVTGIVKPISETVTLSPKNPYAVSKKAQEEMALLYVKAYGLDICMTRSFNHCGPGQSLGFIASDICSGIVAIEQGKAEDLKVGNLEAIRDFTDVRDIVKAYRLIGEKGVSGEVYNVGSGIGIKIQEVLNTLINMVECEIVVTADKDRMRISDTPVVVCDNTKLAKHTGWSPVIPIEATLREALEYYRLL